jgi:hypothetical protein
MTREPCRVVRLVQPIRQADNNGLGIARLAPRRSAFARPAREWAFSIRRFARLTLGRRPLSIVTCQARSDQQHVVSTTVYPATSTCRATRSRSWARIGPYHPPASVVTCSRAITRPVPLAPL